MKQRINILLLYFSIYAFPVAAQHVYPVTGGELIFSQSRSSFTRAFIDNYPGARLANDNIRLTVFLHFGQYVHCDFNNSLGIFSGFGVRNIGMITNETLPLKVSEDGSDTEYRNYNIIRREYLLGVPFALKLGSFRDHFYFFGGGEYELAFAGKEKYWSDCFDRSGSKTKTVRWFSGQTPDFLPSVFGGIQFPGGVNIRFKYYLTDFLNNGYRRAGNSNEGSFFSPSDLTRYSSSHIVYFSLSWQFRTTRIWEKDYDSRQMTVRR